MNGKKSPINDTEKLETRTACSITSPPPENPAVYEIMWKNVGQATDDNMAHVHCMLDT